MKFDAELCYVTGGMSWEADYNIISPEKGDEVEITGWVTIDNQTGKTFPDTTIQLIAGDVAKLGNGSNSNQYRKFRLVVKSRDSAHRRRYCEMNLYHSHGADETEQKVTSITSPVLC